MLNTDSTKPIYIQIAEWLETEIMNGHVKQDEKVYSQYQLADMFNINPATAAKGLNLLAEDRIVYKKRGLGMFVTAEGKDIIFEKRKGHTLKGLVTDIVLEAKRLKVSEKELIQMIRMEINEVKGEE